MDWSGGAKGRRRQATYCWGPRAGQWSEPHQEGLGQVEGTGELGEELERSQTTEVEDGVGLVATGGSKFWWRTSGTQWCGATTVRRMH